jgi:glycosyltransferase involved in cell wall biosynthesis
VWQLADANSVVYLIDGSVARTGAFVAACNIARALEGAARVILVIPDNATFGADELGAFHEVMRLPLRPLRRTAGAAATYLPSLLICALRLSRALRRDRAQALIVNDFHLMQGPLCRLLGFRGAILTWVRIDPAAFGPMSRIWLWAAAAASNRIVAVSKHIRRLLPADLATDLLYDPVDPKFEEATRILQNDGRVFVFVGNYIPGKGQDIALEAMSTVVRAFPDARLEFYGGDMGLEKNRAFRCALVDRARALGLSANVRFGDFVADPATTLNGKLAALNFSRSESYSMTVLEASAFGLPVVATRSGGPEEIIEDGKTGLLTPLDNPASCAEAMIWLCRHPQAAREMGDAARRRVLSMFSRDSFEKKLLSLLALN